ELRSKAATSRPSCAWKSTSSRASSVVPTRERGEATMVTEWRNGIGSPDAARAHALAGGLLADVFHFRPDQIGQLDAIVFAPDVAQPVPNIAAQHEGVVRRLPLGVLVGDEGHEGLARHFHLLAGHLV